MQSCREEGCFTSTTSSQCISVLCQASRWSSGCLVILPCGTMTLPGGFFQHQHFCEIIKRNMAAHIPQDLDMPLCAPSNDVQNKSMPLALLDVSLTLFHHKQDLVQKFHNVAASSDALISGLLSLQLLKPMTLLNVSWYLDHN